VIVSHLVCDGCGCGLPETGRPQPRYWWLLRAAALLAGWARLPERTGGPRRDFCPRCRPGPPALRIPNDGRAAS
jgi:hypothetical protein